MSSVSSPHCFTWPATPTISASMSPWPISKNRRLPIGFSFPKYFCASTSSTTTTFGAFSSSCAVKKRPLRSGVLMIFK